MARGLDHTENSKAVKSGWSVSLNFLRQFRGASA